MVTRWDISPCLGLVGVLLPDFLYLGKWICPRLINPHWCFTSQPKWPHGWAPARANTALTYCFMRLCSMGCWLPAVGNTLSSPRWVTADCKTRLCHLGRFKKKKKESSDKAQEAKLLTEKIPFRYSHSYEKSHASKVMYLTVSGSQWQNCLPLYSDVWKGWRKLHGLMFFQNYLWYLLYCLCYIQMYKYVFFMSVKDLRRMCPLLFKNRRCFWWSFLLF